MVSFLVFYTYCLILGDVQISVTYGQEPSHQCIHDTDDVTLICTVNSLTNIVLWYHGSSLMATCSNTADICIPSVGTPFVRHTFSSSVSIGEFTLRINPVSSSTDAGVYKCEHYDESSTVSLDACGRFPCIYI